MPTSTTTIPNVQQVEFDPKLISKLTKSGPRYTSYPTADRFTANFSLCDYQQVISRVRARGEHHPLSLYLHIPFCDTICDYCGCNKIVTRNKEKAATYLEYLKKEITMQSKLLADSNHVEQCHFGGGTPTYLSDELMQDLMEHIRYWFRLSDDEKGEYSIEVDPRSVTRERIHHLRHLGFNRLSLGVQDFDPEVQKAVNRIQPEQQTLDILHAARKAQFRSISMDIIYGLPKQTLATMERTLLRVIAANPDRISVYHYAHLPYLFKSQRRIHAHDLPDSDTKLGMLSLCIKKLNQVGYVYIGMDHFAKPNDELAVAQRQGRLHRNFQGYSTHAEADLVACGVSAISSVGQSYSQNVKTLEEYYAALDKNELPIARGYKLSMDDVIRRIIRHMLMCNLELLISSLEQAFPITFKDYFAAELKQLQEFVNMGLLTIDDQWISVTLRGRLLIRTICMAFDHHLQQARRLQSETSGYSQTL